MQIANYAVPLLLLPFLTHKLGIESFGIVAIILAAIQFSFVITDYGFTLSATYEISKNRENTDYINKKIGSIFGAKLVLVSGIAMVAVLYVYAFENSAAYRPYIIGAMIAVIAQAFQPTWLFQGIERMKSITIYTVLTKVVYASLVLFFVETAADALLVIYFWGAAQAMGLIASMYLIFSEGYRIYPPTLKSITNEFKVGAQFFWSRLAVSLYASASTLIIGTHSTTQAAQFSVCEQIYKAGQNITSPVNNAMFPYMAKNKDWKVFFGVLFTTGFLVALGCIGVSIFAEEIITTLFGTDYKSATPILLVFLCTTVVNYFAVTFGYSAFAALGKIEIANYSVIAGAAFHAVVLSWIYIGHDVNALNIALAILATETLVMFFRAFTFLYLKKKATELSPLYTLTTATSEELKKPHAN